MTHDPMAHERLRTVLNTVVDAAWDDDVFPELVTDITAETFPEAWWETSTNERGVPVRRVVAATEWEVDPAAVFKGSTTQV